MKSTCSDEIDGVAESGRGGRWFINFAASDDPDFSEWDIVVDFSGYVEGTGRISLPRYLYEIENELISEAVDRIDEYAHLRSTRTNLSIATQLRFDDGISLWYMSGPAEKCIVRNPDLGAYIKLLALERLFRQYKPVFIDTDGTDARMLNAIRQLARESGAECAVRGSRRTFRIPGTVLRLRALLRFATLAIQALAMRHCRPRRDLSNPGEPEGGVLFISYSDNVRRNSTLPFEPMYWKGLPEIAESAFSKVTWAHLYDAASGESRSAFCRRLEVLENSTGRRHRFLLLDQFLSLRIVLSSFLVFLRLQWRLRRIEKIIFRHKSGGVDPWPFLAAAWSRSMKGGTAAAQIVQKFLVNEFAREMGSQKATVYLLEGMPWEQMLLEAWKRHHNGPIYGYQHATMKSFDLRPWSYLSKHSDGRAPYLPAKILVNGEAALQVFRTMGFAANMLVPVEATRFDYVADIRKKRVAAARRGGKVLFVLEGIEAADRFMLGLLTGLDRRETTDKGLHFVIKPHPGGTLSVSDFMASAGPVPNWNESRDEMSEAIGKADIVCASINSSSAVEAQSMTLPSILIWKPSELIRSPTRIRDWSQIVSEPGALQRALTHPRTPDVTGEGIFYLGPGRSRWRILLQDATA